MTIQFIAPNRNQTVRTCFVGTERKYALHGRSNGGLISGMTKFGKEKTREDRRAHHKK